MRVEDEYLDVLQNIEFAIVNEFRNDGSILDLEAADAVSALIRVYEAEAESRGAPNRPLSDRARRIFESVRRMCEWRLGRGTLPGPGPDGPGELKPLNAAELVLCLKRIRKSIDRWNKVGGRQGYLRFVADYVK
ncbi:MAG TPA: hypothetical protein VNY05_40045 [Candidatus Acidoferrales bacterium]|jgi:hypothetical protein|nr:hypothetical protein [Candidatus Acidoferrales bacterium]